MWTRSLATLLLVASVSQLGHSRALPDSDAATDLLPRFDEKSDHSFAASVTHWSRRDEDGAPIPKGDIDRRAVDPIIVHPDDPVIPVTGPKTDPVTGDPTKDPGTGLDPTKQDPAQPKTDPKTDPSTGLDPNKQQPDPVEEKPPPDSDEDNWPGDVCSLKKRAPGGPCPESRTGRPDPKNNKKADAYDFLDEVRREKELNDPTLVNDGLVDLKQRNANPNYPDDKLEMDVITEQYSWDTVTKPLGDRNFKFPDEYTSRELKGHNDFKKPFRELGIEVLDPSPASREAIRSKKGKQPPIARVSWQDNKKVVYFDEEYKVTDKSDANLKLSELKQGLLEKSGVDTKGVDVMCVPHIENHSSMKTIDSIFAYLEEPGDMLVLRSTDTDAKRLECYDAYYRTVSGKSAVNQLRGYPDKWDRREPGTTVLTRPTVNTRDDKKPQEGDITNYNGVTLLQKAQ